MSELQATVEFSIELHKFYNVDLFQRGFYQVRTSLKVSPKLSVKIEVNLARNQKSEHVFAPFVANGYGVSRIFQILYRNQEVLLDNVILFRVHLLVDSFKIEETLEKADFSLNVELWFTEQPYLLSQQNGTCVSIRTLHFHFSPVKGLHYHLPVLFDYFHLAAVTVTIHAVLVALHQPYINTPRSNKTFFGTSYRPHPHQASPIDALFFGNSVSKLCSSSFCSKTITDQASQLNCRYCHLAQQSIKCVSTGARLAHARHVHQEVCSILLTTYDTLQSHLQDYMKLLPTWQQVKLETNDCLKRLNSLNDTAKLIEAEDDFISVANSDIAQLCAENILLWQQFLDAFTCKIPILQHLAKFHHQLRVKRFSEAFFVVDNPRQSAAGCYDANYQNYVAVSETVRRSRYLACLPSLPVTCLELDGDITTMPIIFEDQYKDVVDFARRRNDGLKKSGSDPFLNAIGESITKNSSKENECSCGIVAILESRSQKVSSQQRVDLKKGNSQSTLRVLKGDSSFENQGAMTLGLPHSNKANISNLILSRKVLKNGKILDVGSSQTLPNSRQRHSKSLDQLKNTGIHVNQVPRSSNSIIRSTSSHMPYNRNNNVITSPVSRVAVDDHPNSKPAARLNKTDKEEVSSSSSESGGSEDGRLKKFGPSLSAPYNLCEYPVIKSNEFSLGGRMKHSESTLSMPSTNGVFGEKFNVENRLLLDNNSESMPNLIQTPNDSPKGFGRPSKFNYRKVNEPKDILALYEINNSTIIEECGDDHCTIFEVKMPKDAMLSSPLSSISDELTSEQSGWVSNSSRHSSETRSSSGAPSPETTVCRQKMTTPFLEKSNSLPYDRLLCGDVLIEKLEKLAVNAEKFRVPSNGRNHQIEEVRVPPPRQFRDVPSPPEHFRDPPVTPPLIVNHTKPRKDSVDNHTFHLYDLGTVEKKSTKKGKNLRASIENLAFDLFKESKRKDRCYSKRSKRKGKEKKGKGKVTSDEGFDELEGKCNESDTSVVADSPEGSHSKMRNESKNPFEGYLFKEDIETLRKTYEKKRTKISVQEKREGQELLKAKDKREDKNHEGRDDAKEECDCLQGKDDRAVQGKNLEEKTLTFIRAKEDFKRQMNFTGVIYSDFTTLASTLPYFHISDEYRIFSPEGLHLIVCVHGLDGNSNDLRLVKTYVELGLPGANLEFLMSERNQGDTFSDFETMTDKLVSEILYHIETCGPMPSKISFIGHSLGNIIIRSAITRPQLKHLLPRFHTFLSLSGPHLGTLYNNSGLVNMGMWFMQKWKKSGSLLQLSLKDAADVRQTFLYRLSQKSNLHRFRHILLCGSSQDRYVPMHSARIELCKAAIKDTTVQGVVYREMVHNIIYPVINSAETTLVRYDVHHALPNTANSLIGRAAHIAVLDSELFIEKFLVVTGLKYFR